jgi:hypothetical protein
MLPASLGSLPEISDIQPRYFDVDERLTNITRAAGRHPGGLIAG